MLVPVVRVARVAVVLVLIAAAGEPALAFERAYLPLDHWAYPILDRLRTLGAPIGAHLETRPISRGDALAAVNATDAALEAGTLRLDGAALGQLRLLEREFAPEAGLEPGPRHHARRFDAADIDLRWVLRVESSQVASPDLEDFDPGVVAEADSASGAATGGGSHGPVSPGNQNTNFLWLRPEAWVRVGEHLMIQERLNYRFRFGDTVTGSVLGASEGEAEFVHEEDDFVAVQRTLHTLAQVFAGPFTVAIGRMPLRWGPGKQGTLLLSDFAPPTDFVRVEIGIGRFRFTNLAAELRSDLGQKWMAGHRLAYTTGSLTLGASETVIFGERGFDFAYLSPFQLFYIVEDNIGGLDNNLFSLDARWVPHPGWELYGELVVDDSALRDGWHNRGNKNAFQLGLVRAGLPGLPDTDVLAEWSLVDQYTYTHKYEINTASTYDRPLGHRIGTDADLLTLTLRQWLGPRLELAGGYEQERHGEGDLFKADDERTDDNRNYLTGVVERTRRGFVGLSYRSVRGIEVRADLRRAWVKATDNVSDARRVRWTEGQVWAKVEF